MSAREGSNYSTSLFLSFLYAVISILGKSLTLLPDTGDAEFRLGIFVPALAAIIYGPLAGGLTAGVGNLLIDAYSVYDGTIAYLSIDRFLGALANFVGGYTTGWLAKRIQSHSSEENFIQFSQIPSYIMSTIIGLALLTGGLIGYGILFLFLKVSYSLSEFVFESIFFYNSVVLIVMMSVSLFIYKIFNDIQLHRFELEDQENRTLSVDYLMEEVPLEELLLPERSLWVEEWTPLTIKVKNYEKTSCTYQFEMTSDAFVFPQLDKSPRLNPGETFVQTFYIMPNQDKNIRIRLHVKQLGRKQKSTVANISANPTIVYSQDSLAGFSSVNVVVFAISVLWSNILELISKTLSFSFDSVIILLTFVITEFLILSVYFFLNFRKTKKWFARLMGLDLALPSDHLSYNIEPISDELFSPSPKRSSFLIWTIRLISGIILLFLLIDGYRGIFTAETPFIPKTENITFFVYTSVLALAILSEVVLNRKQDKIIISDDSSSKVPIIFSPLRPFKVGEPTEVTVTLVNTVLDKGMRIVFKSLDFIAPEVIEINVERGKQVTFKINLTSIKVGVQSLLFAVYPLYNSDGKYVEFQESEPVYFHTINYQVMDSLILGMTQRQFEFIINMGGIGSVLVGVILAMNQFVGIDNLILKFRNLLPVLVIIQIPIVYLYFLFDNRFVKSIKR